MQNTKKMNNNATHLILLSFLMLFTELAVIRWTGANFYYLSFFSNFVMIASFLGIAIGFLRNKSSRNLFVYAPIFLATLITCCHFYSYEYFPKLDSANIDLVYNVAYFKNNLIPSMITLPCIFLFVTFMMAAIAQGVANLFHEFEPLQAYRLNILGSLLGILAFSLLAVLNAGPAYWASIISGLIAIHLCKNFEKNYFLAGVQIIALGIALYFPFSEIKSSHEWSPYYKIGVQSYSQGRYVVTANGLPQQTIESVAQRQQTKPFYFYAYQHRNPNLALNRVLIIGAGTGGDVAIALAQGAKHVDAVEIDPVLFELGRQYNPNHPYLDSRVHHYIGDGRAFLQRNHKRYDMIIYALPDSLLLLSGQSSLRLENYLFTVEAIQSVYDHLEPNGIFTMYNYYNTKWVVDRLSNTLAVIFKHAPCLDTTGEKSHWLSSISISRSPAGLQCSRLWQPVQAAYATPSTDNHPFFYLENNSIPLFYIALMAFVCLAGLGAFKMHGISTGAIRRNLEFFLMGSAFLLLETKNISQFALLFGSSWMVNALVFAGILMSVYLAIEVSNRITDIKHGWLYAGLIVALLISWLIPANYFLNLTPQLRFTLATLLAFTPIFIVNLLFADHFKTCENPIEAFAANYLGAVVGGLLEYSAMIIGYNNLIVLIALLYSFAILLMRIKSTAGAYQYSEDYTK